MEPDKWNHLKGCAVGKDRKHQEINLYLETVRNRVFQIHRQLEADGKPITAVTIKNIFYGGYDSPKMLIETFNEHNQEYRELMDKEYAKGTVLRYERTVRYLVEFMREQYNCADIPLKSINYEFNHQIRTFHQDPKGMCPKCYGQIPEEPEKNHQDRHSEKVDHEDPFADIHFKQTKTNRDFLNESELRRIIAKDIDIERLQTVRTFSSSVLSPDSPLRM